MQKLIYYVAMSLDGYIAGPQDDISGFVSAGDGVDQYRRDLADFPVTLMGRKTYEFGYRYGLQPGQPAYPHMEHYIVSATLAFTDAHPQVHVLPPDIDIIRKFKATAPGAIYLCGGGELAGWLFRHRLIDTIKIKLNPFLQGAGIRLFGEGSPLPVTQLRLVGQQSFDGGLLFLEYEVK